MICNTSIEKEAISNKEKVAKEHYNVVSIISSP